MKIVTDQISRHTASANNLEVNSIHQPGAMTEVDRLKGDSKIFPQDISSLICHTKDDDPLQVEMKDYTMEMSGDGCSVLKEPQIEVGFDDAHELCPKEGVADMDNGVQSAADASGMEHEHLVSQEYSRETDGSAVRDICVDEDVPAHAKIHVEDIVDCHKCAMEDSDTAKDTKFDSESVKMELEWHVPVAVGLKSMSDEAYGKDLDSCDSKVLAHHSECESETTGFVLSDLQKDEYIDTVVAEDTYAEESLSEMSMENRCDDKQNKMHKESVDNFEDANDILICSSSTAEATIKETANDSTSEALNMKIDPGQGSTNSPSLPTAVKNHDLELHSNAFHQMPEQQNLACDHLTASARIQPDHFESSFASVGPYTNSIAYSGSVAYSGSLSHRSDASTVSTRSFAFPVLQNEWNFSPVRMRKADRRHLGRRRGWMNGLFCCKF